MKHSHARHFMVFKLVSTHILAVLALLGMFASAQARNMPEFIGYCDNCSEWAFSHAAQNAPPPVPGNYPVYVLDTGNGEVRYFDVDIGSDSGEGTHPQSGEDRAGSAGDSMPHRAIYRQAIPGPGDPSVVFAMEEAFAVVSEFAELLYGAPPTAGSTPTLSDNGDLSTDGVSSGDLGIDIDSAIDLIGPEGSPAGLNRNILRNKINKFYNGLWGASLASTQDLVTKLSNRFPGDGLLGGGSTTITFPDGTSVKLKIDRIADGQEFHLKLQVLTNTVQGPGLPAVPQNPGQFDGFSHGGGETTVGSLADLADRLGLEVGPPGSGATCESGCPPNGNCFVTCPRSH